MKLYTETEVIREVAEIIHSWGAISGPAARHFGGDTFAFYEEMNRRGQFRLKSGAIVVLEPAELKCALNLVDEMRGQT